MPPRRKPPAVVRSSAAVGATASPSQSQTATPDVGEASTSMSHGGGVGDKSVLSAAPDADESLAGAALPQDPAATVADADADADADGTPGGLIPPRIQKQMDTEGIEHFELPRAVVTRVAKSELPDNVQMRKEAVLAISKSATIFISYLAAVSDELAKQNSRKTVNVSDVLEGLGLMEFPDEVRAEVSSHLKVFRQLESDKKAAAASKAGKAGGGAGADAAGDTTTASVVTRGDDEGDEDEAEDEDEEERGGGGQDGAAPAAGTKDVDVDEEDEDTEQRMVEEGAQDGGEEDEQDGDEEMREA